jgi:Stage II sporulation protein E (SpoIIE)
VRAHYQLAWQHLIRSYAATALLAPLFFLLAILAASLILFDRSDRVYWWLAAVFLVTAITASHVCFGVWTQMEGGAVFEVIQDAFLAPLMLGGWVMVWWTWFRLHRPMWVPKAAAVLTLLLMVSTALGEDILFTVIPHPVSVAFHLASVVIRILFLPLLVFVVIRGVRESGRAGVLALPAIVLVGIAQFQNELAVLHIRTSWFPMGTQVPLAVIAYLALAAVIFVLLLRRLLLSIRRQRELALDVKQAQEVQRVLIPEKLPQLPGLAIESEYRPALEVGGDFFQIIPRPGNGSVLDGDVLFVVGDVTGKGLQAGMLVALLVGAIRSTAETHFDPLFVLEALNRRLLGRGQAHATCLALLITADGAVTLANAGHLPPYLNGEALAMEGALPLGMIANAEFSVMRFQLAPGDTLMLMSDGIAEAQDEHGQLFGFERIHALLQEPITGVQIAAAAQQFGQQDDISILSITRIAVVEPALA